VALISCVSECICSTLFQRKNWHIFHGNFLETRAGAGGPVCFLLTWPPFLPSADTQDFFLSAWGSLLYVTSNIERIFPQFEVAQNFAKKFKGVPIITWYGCSDAVYENTQHGQLGFFVLGLPCYITENVNTELSAVNGIPCCQASLSFDEGAINASDLVDRCVRAQVGERVHPLCPYNHQCDHRIAPLQEASLRI
jgi:hypothetical protein